MPGDSETNLYKFYKQNFKHTKNTIIGILLQIFIKKNIEYCHPETTYVSFIKSCFHSSHKDFW